MARRFVEAAETDVPARHVAWFAGGLPPEALGSTPPAPLLTAAPGDPVAWAMQADATVWLRERLLVKLDRATMRVGLEARAPFLDPALVAAATAIPAARHVRGLRGKRVLRMVARSRLPSYILRRTKRGLSVPVSPWLNAGLRKEVGRLLDPQRLALGNLVTPDVVARLVDEHRAQRDDHGRALWTLLTFEAWRERHGLE